MTALPRESDSDDAELQTEDLTQLRSDLLEWYRANRRPLPWREAETAYAVWVSEIMLQQTQVSTVMDYYDDWMERFPDVESLAEADRDDVLEMWEGLGFYRRARYLHESAKRVVEDYGSELPETADGLQELKGIGPYTAGAISSIAFDQSEPLVDGNVRRVLGRLFRVKGNPDTSGVESVFWDIAEEVLDAESPGDFNQALMELGAMICTPGQPSCMLCPVSEHCEAFRAGETDDYPVSSKSPNQKPVTVATSIVRMKDSGRYVVVRRDNSELLSGLWEFPATETDVESEHDISGDIESFLNEEMPFDCTAARTESVGSRIHHFSHLKMTLLIEERILDIRADDCDTRFETDSGRTARWVKPGQLEDIAMSTAMRKVESTYNKFRSS